MLKSVQDSTVNIPTAKNLNNAIDGKFGDQLERRAAADEKYVEHESDGFVDLNEYTQSLRVVGD